MNPSVSNRNPGKNIKSRPRNFKSETKTELDDEAAKNGTRTDQRKYRSSSLSKQGQIKSKESPKKSQSVDRNTSERHNTRNIAIKSSLVDTKNINIGNKKNAISTRRSRNSDASKKEDNKVISAYQTAKSSDKSFRSPMKGPSGKTNLEIAKSFVRNASDIKTKKVVSKPSKKSIEKEKQKSEASHTKPSEKTERPRTSTIRKGASEANAFVAEGITNEAENHENLHNDETTLNVKDPKSGHADNEEEEEDKLSYEEDFEDYDSDFEESDSESISYSDSTDSINEEEENVLDSGIDKTSTRGNTSSFSNDENLNYDLKHKTTGIKKNNEKSFLQMSDRCFLSSNKTTETSNKSLIKPSHSFINFETAVEEEKKKKYSNKILKRASELFDMVEMSDVAYSQIDIPPMKYDTFMRFFGKTDYKQVFVQTENVEDEEIQTDEIEMFNKWTQIPPHDNFGYGGDICSSKVEENESLKSLYNSQNVKLSSFIQNCSKVILTLLDEEFPVSSQVQASQRRNELFYSDGYYMLSPLIFLKDIPVLNVYCSSESSQYVLTIHDGIIKVPQTNDERGVICVWNIFNRENPEQILVAHSQPTCATFGPVGNEIIIAGMVDGCILLWDLSDNSQTGSGESFTVKSPTYSTAVILGKENHHSCIVAIQALVNYSKSETASSNFARTNFSKNFHVLTLEDMGIINIWVVVEVLKPDFSGLETDLGLAPGGKLRLIRSSSLFLYDISALQDIQKINVRTFDFRLVPFDSNRILVTTDAGIVLHVNRQGGVADPRFYANDLDFSSEVRCIDCSPHNEDLFLVGCSDGSAMLYNIKLVHPIKVFLLAARGDPVTLIQWSPIHPSMFLVLSSSSSLHLWNLLEDCLHPINSYNFPDIKITWCTFYNLIGNKNQKSSGKILHMFISRDDGQTEVHVFKHNVSKEEYLKQLEYMKSL